MNPANPEILSKTESYARHELKIVCSPRWSSGWTKEGSAGHWVELKGVSSSSCEVNDCIAGIESRNNSFRRIKLEHCSDISSKTRNATSFHLKESVWSNRADRKEVSLSVAKTDDPGPRLSEDAPAFKALSRLYSADRLYHTTIVNTAKAVSWEEVAGRLETECSVQIVSKSASQSRFSSSLKTVTSLQRSELCREFEFRRLLCL